MLSTAPFLQFPGNANTLPPRESLFVEEKNQHAALLKPPPIPWLLQRKVPIWRRLACRALSRGSQEKTQTPPKSLKRTYTWNVG